MVVLKQISGTNVLQWMNDKEILLGASFIGAGNIL
jgi:hypothetical protein